MRLWLSKPLYEFLPYFYMLVGVLLVVASRTLDAGSWSGLVLLLGLAFVVAGGALWWRRRVYRGSR